MTTRYVAFLRAINTGKRRVKNDALCSHATDLGFSSVAGFLASGNLIFDADSDDRATVADHLSSGLEAALGFDVPVFLRTATEVRAIAEVDVFSPAELARTLGKVQVTFLAAPPLEQVASQALALGNERDQLRLRGSELFWLPEAGISTSELHIRGLERLLGAFTIRTLNSVVRLSRKFLG